MVDVLKKNLTEVLNQLDLKYERSVGLLTASYDEYMKKMSPAPSFLPVRLKIIFPNH